MALPGPESPAGTYRPDPGAASTARQLAAQAKIELVLTLRRGESVLLTLIIPVVLLTFFASVDVLPHGAQRSIDFLVPGILALAVMSTAFTGQAIATGFERSYGVLKRLGAAPLPRAVLLGGKTLAVLAVEVLQVIVICALGLALGWHPHTSYLAVILLILLGTVAFSGLGLLMAGTLRAEATLAAANGLWLILLLLGGVVFPLAKLPGPLQAIGKLLPTAAMSSGLRHAFTAGASVPVGDVLILLVWAVAAITLAARTFRWE
jgi:ABC-2 type transport system permease protein